MRPVNLLPERDRAQAPAAAGGSSYVVVGVLAALLLAVFAYVVTSNQVNSRTAAIAEAEAEATQAETRAASFGSFQQFAQIKAARLASVKTLADTRFDWERLMRELALVLPSGSSLTAVTAASGEAVSATAPPTTSSPATATPTTPGVPTLALTGCATSQPRVAVILVRLRQLHRAVDVQLVDSTQSETESAPATGVTGCFGSDYTFNASVTFDPAPAAKPKNEGSAVPSTLGGGA
jgi:Tfp pilus assembly protein PilN